MSFLYFRVTDTLVTKAYVGSPIKRTGKKYYSQSVVIQPDFDPEGDQRVDNDVAIVTLENGIKFGYNIAPICLPSPNILELGVKVYICSFTFVFLRLTRDGFQCQKSCNTCEYIKSPASYIVAEICKYRRRKIALELFWCVWGNAFARNTIACRISKNIELGFLIKCVQFFVLKVYTAGWGTLRTDESCMTDENGPEKYQPCELHGKPCVDDENVPNEAFCQTFFENDHVLLDNIDTYKIERDVQKNVTCYRPKKPYGFCYTNLVKRDMPLMSAV